MNITLSHPAALLLLLLLPCFWRCKREPLRIYFSKTSLYPTSLFSKTALLAPTIFSLLVISAAGPFVYSSVDFGTKKGRDLVLAIDTSGSMDFEIDGKSKFAIVKELAKNFIQSRYDDNIGIVSFGSFAYIASPITYDLQALSFLLDFLQTSLAGNNTAIGEAIDRSLEALQAGDAKEKVIVLFTDGYHNAGAISPKAAVQKAKKMGVKIYTVGIGEDFDKKLLAKIAKESGGKSFAAKTKEDLQKVFDAIAQLEPSPIRNKIYRDKIALFWLFSLFAAILILARMRR